MDSSTRAGIIFSLMETLGLLEEDLTTIMVYVSLGDLSTKDDIKELIKGRLLPKLSHNVSPERVKRAINLIKIAGEEIKSMTVIDASNNVVLQEGNKRTISLFGFKIHPIVFNKMVHLMEVQPQYVYDVIVGIRDKLNLLISYLEGP